MGRPKKQGAKVLARPHDDEGREVLITDAALIHIQAHQGRAHIGISAIEQAVTKPNVVCEAPRLDPAKAGRRDYCRLRGRQGNYMVVIAECDDWTDVGEPAEVVTAWEMCELPKGRKVIRAKHAL